MFSMLTYRCFWCALSIADRPTCLVNFTSPEDPTAITLQCRIKYNGSEVAVITFIDKAGRQINMQANTVANDHLSSTLLTSTLSFHIDNLTNVSDIRCSALFLNGSISYYAQCSYDCK